MADKQFDPNKYFDTCHGAGPERYLQDGVYYDAHFHPVGENPKPISKVVTEARRRKTEKAVETANAQALPLSVAQLRGAVPSPVAEIKKENEAAAAAEENAE
jgi:hypothetical protein